MRPLRQRLPHSTPLTVSRSQAVAATYPVDHPRTRICLRSFSVPPQILWGSCGWCLSLISQTSQPSRLGDFTATPVDCGECVYCEVWENQSSVYLTNIDWMWDTQMSKTWPLLLKSSQSIGKTSSRTDVHATCCRRPVTALPQDVLGQRGMGAGPSTQQAWGTENS